MNACGCGRTNDARRSYCGGCGTRIARACARCQFVNATDDAYCGGCGDELVASVVAVVSGQPPAPARPLALLKSLPPIPAPAPSAASTIARPAPASADTMSAAELATLLGPSAVPVPAPLPSVVSQDDLDRLFGGVA